MQCPHCESSRLLLSDRSGVEIDYCPQCRGVWLDRGELDKLIERASVETSASRQRPMETQLPPSSPRHHDDDDDDFSHRRRPEDRRKKNWLAEFFD